MLAWLWFVNYISNTSGTPLTIFGPQAKTARDRCRSQGWIWYLNLNQRPDLYLLRIALIRTREYNVNLTNVDIAVVCGLVTSSRHTHWSAMQSYQPRNAYCRVFRHCNHLPLPWNRKPRQWVSWDTTYYKIILHPIHVSTVWSGHRVCRKIRSQNTPGSGLVFWGLSWCTSLFTVFGAFAI